MVLGFEVPVKKKPVRNSVHPIKQWDFFKTGASNPSTIKISSTNYVELGIVRISKEFLNKFPKSS